MYEVHVNDIPPNYQRNYFPRKFRFKKEAIEAAKLAIEAGATMARVECPNGGELDFHPNKKEAK